MAIVAGADFGILSVRVALVDTERGSLGSGSAEYPLQRTNDKFAIAFELRFGCGSFVHSAKT